MEAGTKRVEIIPAKRRALILDHLRVNGATSIQQLADAIGGSQSTIRRDLDQLVESGYLERTHGGALLLQPRRATYEREPPVNAQMQRAEKVAIGTEAALRLSPGDSVILDSSSTVLEAATAAAERNIPLTIVTNSLDIARLGAQIPIWRIIMPGGTIRQGSTLLAGEPGESFIKTVHADLCMFGAYAVSGPLLTDTSLEVASFKRAMIGSARRRILLVDSTKFAAPGFCTFAEIGEVDEIITDQGASPEVLASLRSFDKRVTIADRLAPL